MISRRHLLAFSSAAPLMKAAGRTTAPQPNVLLIVSDDQGYGDLSLHGNPYLKTPNLDRIGTEGIRFTQFQVCPVCSPTRASLMTGRYNYRTGVVDTYLGRSMMDPREVTAAELFRDASYKTGIFGKWHLGDNYPMRACDKGFDESLVHGGGGLAQPADPPPGNSYFNPVLLHNGKFEKTNGYCTDIYFDRAMQFIEKNRKHPFFVYLPTNAPHTPLQVAETYVEPFWRMGLDETTAKVYGMVRNLDENTGKMLAHLDRLGLTEHTIVIFMTDNGPQQRRFNAGMRGLKGSVYQGGIRVPFFMRWPARWAKPALVNRIAAHIDVLPTLVDACGIAKSKVAFDGRSLMPLLDGNANLWPERTLHTQWHRGDEPQLFRGHAARSQRWKLVEGKELYDLSADPAEKNDVAASHPDIVAAMRKETEEWFRSVSATRDGYPPCRIFVGTSHETPTLLTRQDWRGPRASWNQDGIGYWEIDVRSAGTYDVHLQFAKAAGDGEAVLRLGSMELRVPFTKSVTSVQMKNLRLPKGPARLEPVLLLNGQERGVYYAEVTKRK